MKEDSQPNAESRRFIRRDFVPPIGLNWDKEEPSKEELRRWMRQSSKLPKPVIEAPPPEPVEWAPRPPEGDEPPFP